MLAPVYTLSAVCESSCCFNSMPSTCVLGFLILVNLVVMWFNSHLLITNEAEQGFFITY